MVTAHDGINVYVGNNPNARGGFQPVPGLGLSRDEMFDNARKIAEREEDRALKASEVSKFWKRRALNFVRENPSRFVRLVGEKILAFFNAYEISDVISMETMKRFSSLLKFGLLPYGFIAPFAILGMILAIRRRTFAPLYLFVIANLLAVIITFVNSRYRLTVLPLFLIFSGVSLVWLKDNVRYRWRLIAGIAAIVLSFLVLYKPLVAHEEPAVNAYNLANAYSYMGKVRLAEQEYLKALALKPGYEAARYGLGMLYWESGKVDAAKREFLEVLKARPNDVDALNQLGNISLFKDDRKAARDYWQRSLSIDPNQPEVKEALQRNKLVKE
jgi:tetratricopeptide (TPR) repeat protein